MTINLTKKLYNCIQNFLFTNLHYEYSNEIKSKIKTLLTKIITTFELKRHS